MQHPDESILLRYVADRVSDQEQLTTDLHLADCPACAQRVQALRYLRKGFTTVWNSWTAAEHGRLCRQSQLVRSLHEVAEAKPSLAARVGQWLQALQEEIEVSLKVLIDQSHDVASLAHGVLPADWQFKLHPAYVGVGTPEEQKALQEHLEKSSLFLSEDRDAEAVAELVAAVEIDARRPQSASSDVWHGGRQMLQTAVDGRGRMWVKFWPEEGQEPPALALLLPHRPDGKVLAAEFESVGEDEYVVAEFQDVPAGLYALRLGPIHRHG